VREFGRTAKLTISLLDISTQGYGKSEARSAFRFLCAEAGPTLPSAIPFILFTAV